MASDGILAQAETIIRDAVLSRRERGMKVAIHEVAVLFGLSPRRVKGLLYGEVKALWATEWETIRTRYDRWCDLEIQRLEDRAAALRARRNAMGPEV